MIRSEERRKIRDSRAMRRANCKQRLDFRDVSLWENHFNIERGGGKIQAFIAMRQDSKQANPLL
jgi:hypothetical protein